MGLEPLEEEIRRQAQAEASSITDQAKQERERILGEARRQGQGWEEEASRRAKEAGERGRVQALARAQLESQKIVLLAQKEVLDQARDETVQRLGDFPGNDRILKALLERYRPEIDQGKVYCSEKDAALVKKLVGKRFGGTILCVGGLVIESNDGSWRIDLRYETLLQGVWERSMKEIADLLWRS